MSSSQKLELIRHLPADECSKLDAELQALKAEDLSEELGAPNNPPTLEDGKVIAIAKEYGLYANEVHRRALKLLKPLSRDNS